jgi:hypothetical protein
MTLQLTSKGVDGLTPKQRTGFGDIIDTSNRMISSGDLLLSDGRFTVSRKIWKGLENPVREGLEAIVDLLNVAAQRGAVIVKDDRTARRVGSIPAGLDDEGSGVSTGLNRTRDSLGSTDSEDWPYDELATSRLPGSPTTVMGGDAERSTSPEDEAVRAAADRILAVLSPEFRTGDRQNRRDFDVVDQETRGARKDRPLPVYSNPATDDSHAAVIKSIAAEVTREIRGELGPLDPDEPSRAERVHRGVRGMLRSFFDRRPE